MVGVVPPFLLETSASRNAMMNPPFPLQSQDGSQNTAVAVVPMISAKLGNGGFRVKRCIFFYCFGGRRKKKGGLF